MEGKALPYLLIPGDGACNAETVQKAGGKIGVRERLIKRAATRAQMIQAG